MKKILLFLLFFPLVVVLIGFILTLFTENNELNKSFKEGRIFSRFPDGYYTGTVDFPFKRGWRGKLFNEYSSSGINIFNDKLLETQQYEFKMTFEKSLKNKNLDVIRLDYNVESNPAWLRGVVDEIVEIDKDKFIGKAYVRIVPGFPFSLSYFFLEKE